MITVTKKFEFSYGHHLPGYQGDCSKNHGHNSEVEIELASSLRKDESIYKGMICDFKDIKKGISPIIDELDHSYLNDLMEIPTAEEICMYIVNEIQSAFPDAKLVRVRVSETSDSFAEWRKD